MTQRIVECNWLQAKTDIAQLRREVFILEQGVPEDLEWDDKDEKARHFGIWQQGELIAYLRLVKLDPLSVKLTRMAVQKAVRNRGYGSELVEGVIGQCRSQGLAEIVLDAQLTARSFYQRQGFLAHGPVFWDAGIEHIAMSLQL